MKVKTHVVDVMALNGAEENVPLFIYERISSKSFNRRRKAPRHVKHIPAKPDKTFELYKFKGHFTEPAVIVTERLETRFGTAVLSRHQVLPAQKHMSLLTKMGRFRKVSENKFERFCDTDPFDFGFMDVEFERADAEWESRADREFDEFDRMWAGLPVALWRRPAKLTVGPERPKSGTLLERVAALRAKKAGVPVAAQRPKRNRQMPVSRLPLVLTSGRGPVRPPVELASV